jgi:two-component system NtrC family sensor kinase
MNGDDRERRESPAERDVTDGSWSQMRPPPVDADELVATASIETSSRDGAYYNRLRRSLRWKLLATYVIPLVLLTIFFLYNYERSLRAGIVGHIASVAEHQRNTVELYLQERIADVRNSFPHWTATRPPVNADSEVILENLRRECAAFVDVGIFDPDGTLVAYAGPHPDLVGRQYGAEPWWAQLMGNQDGILISDVYPGFRDEPHFVIAVRGDPDESSWVLRASLDPGRFADFIGIASLDPGAESLIVNAKGVRQVLVKGEASSGDIEIVPPPGPATSVVEVTSASTRWLAGVAHVGGPGWAVVVRVPVTKANAPIDRARLILLVFVLAALVLIVVIVWHNTKRMVDELKSADQASTRLRDQLFNAAKLASVGEMAAGIAHEINNPLAIIHEEAGLMQDLLDPDLGSGLDEADFRERLREINDAVIRGRTITRKLLAFSRKTEGKRKPVDPNELVERILSMKSNALRVTEIEVTREFQTPIPAVRVDPNEIEQVLLNLVNNALDAMQGTGRLIARTRAVDGAVQIEIEDTGCGMDEETMEKVFFPFFTTKGVGKGTGLGLSISYGIVKSAGGRIEVSSEPGTGTVFTVTLPVDRKAND